MQKIEKKYGPICKYIRTENPDAVNYLVGVSLVGGQFFAFFMNDKGEFLKPASPQIWGSFKKSLKEKTGKEPKILPEKLERSAITFATKTPSAIRLSVDVCDYISGKYLENKKQTYNIQNIGSKRAPVNGLPKRFEKKKSDQGKPSGRKLGKEVHGQTLGDFMKASGFNFHTANA